MKTNSDRLHTRVVGLDLRSPCIVASSVLTGDIERIRLAERFGAGAVSTKMALPMAPPASQPDIIIRPKRSGIVSPGDKRLIVDDARLLVKQAKGETDLVVIANILAPADDLEAWQMLAVELQKAGADALELDISCPNIPKDVDYVPGIPLGTCVAQFPEATERVTRAVKSAVDIPVLCKLTAQVVDIAEIARACERGGADGIVAINGFRAAPPIDIWNGGRPKYVTLERHNLGTLSGAPLFPIACRMVAEIVRAVDLPVIGCGGVSSWQDAVEMMMWGASAVEMCASIIVNGFEVLKLINAGIEGFVVEQGYGSVTDFVGEALKYMAPSRDIAFRKINLSVDRSKCNMCRVCLKPGICVAISASDDMIIIDNDRCLDCGTCVQVCPRQAIKIE